MAHDLIVIGAGPAGSSAARTAADLGLRTLLLERDRFPRHKPCGGGLTRRALDALEAEGFDIPRPLLERDIFGARVRCRGRSVHVEADRPVAHTVSRARFDELLLRRAAQAGAEVRTGEKVLDVRQTPDTVTVRTDRGEHEGRLAVICEGASGRLKLAVRPRDDAQRRWFCLCTDEPLPEPQDPVLQRCVEIDFDHAPSGYAWVFPRDGVANVGLGALSHDFPAPREALCDYLARTGLSVSDARAPARDWKGHLIPLGGLERRLCHDRLLLAGDAGGFADAFSCEGIAFALLSGRAAAEAAHLHLTGGQRLCTAYRSLTRPVRRHLRWSLRALRLIHSLPEPLFAAVLTDAAILRRYLDVLAGRHSYARFLARVVGRLGMLALSTGRTRHP